MQGFCFMMKIIILLIVFSSSQLYAGGFEGCGEYFLKGVVRIHKTTTGALNFVVNENTKSQMEFLVNDKKELQKLAILIDAPIEFKAKILKKMDGTKGEFVEATEINNRLPNPLLSTDTGITKLRDLKCN